MMDWVFEVLNGFTAMSLWEYIAVFFAVAYVLFAIKENNACWPAAFINTFIYTVLYWNGALLMESLLNFYYLIMAIVGWWMWRSGRKNKPRPMTTLSVDQHLKVIFGTTIIALSIGFITDNYTHADLPYLDSMTTCFAIMTTYLLAKKVLENWLYWIVINAASIYLNYVKGFHPTAVLYVFYMLMAFWGYKTWYEEYTQRTGRTIDAL